MNMKQINTANKQHVRKHAQTENTQDGTQSTRVSKIEYVGIADVYNMDVRKHENFSINGGLIVHNSIDCTRYSLENDMPVPIKRSPKPFIMGGG